MTNRPKISVLMSVYNTELDYLEEAITSILNQSFEDFEFLIVDDASGNEVKTYLHGLKDPRIQLITNEENKGLTQSLNIALKASQSDYLARMDSDDVALPNRFQKQLAYMEQHPEYAVIGSRFTISNKKGIFPKQETTNAELRKIHLLFYNDGICHPTAFFRKQFLEENHITYQEEVKKAQDYAIWVDIVRAGGEIGICPEVLLMYRVHDQQITHDFSNQMLYEQMTIRSQLNRFDPSLGEEDCQLFYHFYRGEIESHEEQLLDFLKRLIVINQTKHLYNESLFVEETRKIWKLAALKQIKKKHRFTMLKMESRLKELD